jgi:DNA repair protein RadD
MLTLRPRQQEMTDKARAALMEHGNTLCVAPTGAGKTIMLSSVIKDHLKLGEKCLVLQHTDEILDQNRAKFEIVDSSRKLSVVNGKIKDFSGDVIFSMVQSLQRETTLCSMPRIDLLVIDEAHHSVAPTYERILNQAKANNPSLHILGMTATPTRADKHGLAQVFSNVADQITIEELVASGDLLYPKTFVIASDIQDKIKKSLWASEDEENSPMEDLIAEIDQSEIVKHWQEKAQGRKTVIFCSRVEHSLATVETFNAAGIKAVHIDGTFRREERQQALDGFTQGDTEVICNVGVLTEGWDYPPVSCIILLRAYSSQPAMVQMIGRGLRNIDPSLYPDCAKTDCIVLDFGLSVSHHGSIESKVDLLPKKKCPVCKSFIPSLAKICPKCGADFERKAKEKAEREAKKEQKRIQRLKDIEMRELALERAYRQREEQRYQREKDSQNRTLVFSQVDESAWMASGSEGYALMTQVGSHSFSVLMKSGDIHETFLGTRQECLQAGSHFLYQYGGQFLPFSNETWGDLSPSESQMKILEQHPHPPQTRRQACALIAYKFHKRELLKREEHHTPLVPASLLPQETEQPNHERI